ncbi:hypothetical protein A7982_12764 [Minicystis rosea]|nr:hypothetical protein A7982_12764 [Minicystis rosea]
MGIDAVALLRGTELEISPRLLVRKLADGLLVHTGVRFGGAPDELGLALRGILGSALEAHQDARGVFVLPDVAEPRAQTYEGVIAEIGEAGEWAPIVASGYVPARFAEAPEGSLEGVMGQVMAALGGGVLEEMQRALATGDMAAMAKVQEKLVSALGGEEQLEAINQQLLAAAQAEAPLDPFDRMPIDTEEIDFESPDMADLMKQVEQQLAADPERRAALEKMLRGTGDEDAGDDSPKKP